jgi:hypothetical protein
MLAMNLPPPPLRPTAERDHLPAIIRKVTREDAKKRWLLEFPYDGPLVAKLKAVKSKGK